MFGKTAAGWVIALVLLQSAEIQNLQAQEQVREARGLVRSAARVEVRTDLVAAVADAPFGEGMRFKKGDLLISFDCDRYRAEFNSAKAAARAAGIEVRNKRSLVKHGAAGHSELEMAQADAARTAADAKARKVRVAQCVVKAPFAGRVVSLNARKYEMPKPGEPVIVVLDDAALELELVLPSRWLTWVKAGQVFAFLVDETGLNHEARVSRIGAEVDPVSQTIKVYGTLVGAGDKVLAGMSGVARFPVDGS